MKAKKKRVTRMRTWKGWALSLPDYVPELFVTRRGATLGKRDVQYWNGARVVRVEVREIAR